MLVLKVANPVILMVMRIFSLFIFILTILSAFGGRVNPDYLTVPSLLCLFLPYLSILTFLLTLFWAFCRKIIFTAIGVVTIFLCLGPIGDVFPMGHSSKPHEGEETFTILAWNILHTNDIAQPDYPGNRAIEYLVNSDADIICLTELYGLQTHETKKADPAMIDTLLARYPYHPSPSSDITFLSKYPAKRTGYSYYSEDGTHRFDLYRVNFPGNKEVIVGMVHLQSYGLTENEREVVTEIKSVNTAKKSLKEMKGSIMSKMRTAFRIRAEQATILREVLDDLNTSIPVIICGDFNDVPASWTYNAIRGDDMKDAYIATNFGPAITYNLHMFYFRIDQMFYRGDIKAIDLTIGKINTSDHFPLIGEFAFTN